MTYGIIGAMDAEIKLLTAHMEHIGPVSHTGMTFYTGLLCGKPVVVVKCGIGKVNAAVCTQALIGYFRVDTVINVGVAGGVSPKLNVCDVVVATQLVQHDFDLTPFGHAKGFMGLEGGGDHLKPTVFIADPSLVSHCTAAAKQLMTAHTCYKGLVASGDVFIADSASKIAVANQFGALAVEMEGAAIAQAATMNAVPFVVLRTISDLAEGNAPVSFDTVVQYAADLSAKIIMQMLQNA